MTCMCKADGRTSGSLEFSLGGERFLTFDSETEEYRADNSLGERLKKKWENDEDLNKFFKMTLKGDCKKLHQCSVHWKKHLERTAASTTAIATVPSKAAMNMPIAWWICPVILTWITIVGFLGGSLQLQLLRAGLSGK
ncbi:NKG2D ligand 3 [Myotis brandtii]|uniref:NKG2D ligand 3 n=1 Tax=Myotis brandtii TaxID=109478 RepID=S7NNG0_MYOBR|nr:NKG2D ligand 3 [Myotis brandtii]